MNDTAISIIIATSLALIVGPVLAIYYILFKNKRK